MWTTTTRAQHGRAGLRYGSDLTHAAWSAKRTTGGPRGYAAGKKVKRRKRHTPVDTEGRALKLHGLLGDIQGRDGAVPLLRASR